MNRPRSSLARMILWRLAAGLTLFLASLWVGVELARAGEIVPAIGVSRTLDGDEPSRTFASLAIRGDLLPLLQAEVGVGYHSEDVLDQELEVRMWPVTASLWLTPLPALYAGGGVGWYHTTFDYASGVPLSDETRENYGVHLGGGLKVPLGGAAAVDLGGRYVMLRPQESPLIPQHFDPDFWTTTLGLAIRF
ncbi:MAG TPA: hypothetical protein VMJ70_06805 [Candidatus Sulfotelmatobacter sp.]|nr:hypothetical protein [Candidatus Sulfotelmatobacter sp.]